MERMIIALIIPALLSCSKPQRASVTFPKFQDVEDELINYEGVLPTESGLEVSAELSLKPAPPGLDSYYWLSESLNNADAQKLYMHSRSVGTYAVLNGPDASHIIQILSRKRMKAVARGKVFRRPDYVTEDLLLRSNGDHELVLLDEDLQEVVPRYTLTRRSTLFTVEGYFTVNVDSTTEYYERNTGKTWDVARLGDFNEAVSKYHWIAKEKFEGVYLKALSYSVRQVDETGEETDALVFKRILQMNRSKAFH